MLTFPLNITLYLVSYKICQIGCNKGASKFKVRVIFQFSYFCKIKIVLKVNNC